MIPPIRLGGKPLGIGCPKAPWHKEHESVALAVLEIACSTLRDSE